MLPAGRCEPLTGPPYVPIDEFDGTNGFVKTRAFVNYTVNLRTHEPRQKVVLGNSELGDVRRPCVVYTDAFTLEKGCGYDFGGIDRVYEPGDEVQLYLKGDGV